MKAKIVERNWVQEWFDERQCNHMPSLTLGYSGTLLATWCGGRADWNGDPMDSDCNIWLSRLEKGAKRWGHIEAVGTDMKYACHNGSFFRNRHGEILLIFAKFLDTLHNKLNWCNKRDKLWFRKSKDGGLTWLPNKETNIPLIGHPSNDGILLSNGNMLMAISSSEDPDLPFGAVRILRSEDDGETWNIESLIKAIDGTKIREPVLVLRPDGNIVMFTRACPADLNWGRDEERKIFAYMTRSADGGKTWRNPKASTITNNESKIDVVSWSEKAIIMAYNKTCNLDWHERSPLWLAYSNDEGEHWENLIETAAGPGNKCQPAMCKDEEGLLHIIYMHRHTAVEHVVVEIS